MLNKAPSYWYGHESVPARMVVLLLVVLSDAHGSRQLLDGNENPGLKQQLSTGDTSSKGEYGWIVVLDDDPTVTYQGGGQAGMAATAVSTQTIGQKPDFTTAAVQAYAQYLETKSFTVASRVGAADKVTYTYKNALSGFHVTSLTEQQRAALRRDPAVAFIAENKLFQYNTLVGQGTPHFLGLASSGSGAKAQRGVWDAAFTGPSQAGEGVVIGVVDTGIYPEHPSFADRANASSTGPFDYTPVNSLLYKGTCTAGEQFDPAKDCNRKLIGCQYFGKAWGSRRVLSPASEGGVGDLRSCRDKTDGHGTHVAATAGGNHGVPFLDSALSGMAPHARIAMYKAGWADGFLYADIVAAVDQAIVDGVDVINFSVSGLATEFPSPVELAFMRAARAGIFVVAAAGNSGPFEGTVTNTAPWISTVAASTHNRLLTGTTSAALFLGKNGSAGEFYGEDNTWFNPGVGPAPIALAENLTAPGGAAADAKLCLKGSLDPAKTRGKIVVCERGDSERRAKSLVVKQAGGIGMVLLNSDTSSTSYNAQVFPDAHSVPTIHLPADYRDKLRTYIATKSRPIARIQGMSADYNATAPLVAEFSSVGPDAGPPGGVVLKPDLAAPGQNIIAAIPDTQNTYGYMFAMWSGTSMATPHISGLGALVRQKYPSWSPMMIKSALMTTAYRETKTGEVGRNIGATPFYYGAGNVDPTRMLNPGLVFDSTYEDWATRFVCKVKTPDVTLPRELAQYCKACRQAPALCDPANLNTPSIALPAVVVGGTVSVTRTVKSVLNSPATFTAATYLAKASKENMKLTVKPVSFTLAPGKSQVLNITVKMLVKSEGAGYMFGWITWRGKTASGERMQTKTRIPVAAQSRLWVEAPIDITVSKDDLTSTDAGVYRGTYKYNVISGYTGTLELSHNGLQPPSVLQKALVGYSAPFEVNVTVPSGLALARFAIFSSDVQPLHDCDLDLLVFKGGEAVGDSRGFTADEQVSLPKPDPGVYTVHITALRFEDGSSAATYLHVWLLDNKPADNMKVPASLPVVAENTSKVTLTFTGLQLKSANSGGIPPSRYLGSVDYARNGGKAINHTTNVLVNG